MKYIQNNAKFQIFPHIDIYRLPLVGKKGPGEGLNSSNLVKISSNFGYIWDLKMVKLSKID